MPENNYIAESKGIRVAETLVDKSHIVDMVDRLQDQVSRLDNSLSVLHTRLIIASLHYETEDESVLSMRREQAKMSPLAETLSDLVGKLERLNDRVLGITERLDV